MVQDTPARALNISNGLAPHQEAVRAARERLARDLDVFNVEMRSEMGHAMEKTMWKLVATGAAVIAGAAVRSALMSAWRACSPAVVPRQAGRRRPAPSPRGSKRWCSALAVAPRRIRVVIEQRRRAPPRRLHGRREQRGR